MIHCKWLLVVESDVTKGTVWHSGHYNCGIYDNLIPNIFLEETTSTLYFLDLST